MFQYLNSLESIEIKNFKTSNGEDRHVIFASKCTLLTSINIGSFDTSNVKDFFRMYQYCSSLESLDLFKYNVKNSQNLAGFFMECNVKDMLYIL